MFDFKRLSPFRHLALTPAQLAEWRRQRAAAAAPRARDPNPKKATHKEPAPRTPTAAEREAERKADRRRREREFERLMEFVRDPSATAFEHLANYRAPEVELPQVAEQFNVGHGSDAAEFETHVGDAEAMAREVLRCGEMARGTGPQRPAPTGLAAQVIEAGRKRRGESEASRPALRVVAENDRPVVATAEAILRAGARRRGEIND
jgi:hypothetical protein